MSEVVVKHEEVPMEDIELGNDSTTEETKHDQTEKRQTNTTSKSLRFQEGGLKEATLVWKNLNKSVDLADGNEKKQILFDLSGSAKPGEMIALMGPSGSGKTTLLNILGGRALANVTGDVKINNKDYSKSMKRSIAYVLQEDIFYIQLTVRQQLYFTSNLRLPDSVSKEEKAEIVNHVITTLRIDKCADTKIMLISGGEKKRCNIGTELLTNPCIILLDEPTSGLDSTAANSLIQTLRNLAEDRMTVISSIHQPNSKMFYAFDKLILLADGRIVYSGPPKDCMSYLATKNYCPPGDYNPADFIMDLVTSTDAVEGREDGKSVRTLLVEAWDNRLTEEEAILALKTQASTQSFGKETDQDMGKYMASYQMQFFTLFERAVINSQSSLFTNLALFQTIAISLICGLAWFRMSYTENRVDDRGGFIFFFMTYWFFMTLFQGMMQFIPERNIILKERASGTYRLSTYFLSKTLAETPIKLLMPFLFLAIAYPMANLNPRADAFFAIVGTQLLAALAGESVGLFIGTITMDYEKAMVIATLTSLALMLAGGFFIRNLPVFVQWIRYISPFKYSYDACLQLEFSRQIPCDGGDVLVECIGNDSVSGQTASDFLGATESVALNSCMLIVFTVAFRFFAYLALRFMPHNSGRT